jgi:hypothetical protein
VVGARSARVAQLALVVVIVAVFTTWLTGDDITLNGTQGPNDGWLAVLVALMAFGFLRSLRRGSWIGVLGVGGAAFVIGMTAVDDLREGRALGASVGYGALLVIAASVVIGAVAILGVVDIRRGRTAGAVE